MIVDRLIATAPTAIEQVDAPRDEDPGRHRDRDDVVAGRPDEVLDHLARTSPGRAGSRRPRRADRCGRARSRPTRPRRPSRPRSRSRRRRSPAPGRRSRRRRPSPPAGRRPGTGGRRRPCRPAGPAAATSSMPSRRATASATARLSPVIIATRHAHRVEARRPPRATRAGSRPRAPSAPTARPSTMTWRTVRPSAAHAVVAASSAASGTTPSSSRRRGPPTWTDRPSTVARAPRPASASKPWAAAAERRPAPGRADDRPGPAGARSRPRPPAAARSTAASSVARCRHDGGHDRLADGEGAGLVEDDDVELARPLEREAVLDEEAVPGAQRRGDRDDERDGEAERVGAGDHEDRRGADERLLRVAEDPPGGRA